MRGKTRPEVSMSVPADGAFLPLTIAFVEKAALGLGLEEREAMALTLATEEIFAYLCRIASPDQKMDVACRSGGYYVRVDFFFPVEHFEMRLFNLTAKVSLDDEASIEQMGLLIASRFVDRLSVREEPGRGFYLSLTKEKSYPESAKGLAPEKETVETFTVRGPEPEELKLFVQQVKGHYASEVIPSSLAFAGKVVDMVAGGEYQAAVAVGPAGQMAGGILWHWAGLKTVECFGPYIFTDPPQTSLSRALLEACLGAIGKSHAVGLITRYATRDLPTDHFETLGTLTAFDQQGTPRPVTAFFRQMQEDPGTVSWCHAELQEFLRKEYRRLVLPRETRVVQDQGEARDAFSVLSAEFDRPQGMVVLRPVRSGRDMEENLANHIEVLAKESLRNLFFEMDLGQPFQSHFTPALLKHGFGPCFVLPYAGDGDIVVFQRSQGPA